jgi:hypothetical protein
MGQVQSQVLERISGPAWDQIRPAFLSVSDALLAVGPETCGQLTTIYVKYTGSPAATEVYAVVWIKTSKQLVVGLALPESVEDPELGDPPSGTRYKGLTKYFVLRPGDPIPGRLSEWARAAYEHVYGRQQSGAKD